MLGSVAALVCLTVVEVVVAVVAVVAEVLEVVVLSVPALLGVSAVVEVLLGASIVVVLWRCCLVCLLLAVTATAHPGVVEDPGLRWV